MKKIFTLIFLVCSCCIVSAQGIYQLFGATGYGGPDDRGTLFTTRFDGTGHTIKKLFTVPNPGSPSYDNRPVYLNGKFYTLFDRGGLQDYGLISEYDPATGVYKKVADLYSIGAENAPGHLTVYNNKLYGTSYETLSSDNGCIFEYNPASQVLTKLHEFESSTGTNSNGNLAVFNNKLYGTTISGGANGQGVIYEFDPATNVYSKKKDLSDLTTGGFSRGSFIVYNNLLWTINTYSTGPMGGGYLVSYNPATNVLSPKVELGSISAGYHFGTLAVLNNKFYGVAEDELVEDGSVIFQYDPANNQLTREKTLTVAMGYSSSSLLTYNGLLYGCTSIGGPEGDGSLFTYDPVNNVYSHKLAFSSNLGGDPQYGMTLLNNKMYGIVSRGGYEPTGILFEFNPAGNVYTPKVQLGNNNIIRPNGRMALHNNVLYGVGSGGGASDQGGLFSYNLLTNVYSELYALQGSDGNTGEQGGLTYFNNKLYGVASFGSADDAGTLFEYDLGSNIFTKLFTFGGANGKWPRGHLVEFGGKLYGTTSNGGINDQGTLFEFNPANNQVTTKVLFDITRGDHPTGALTLHNGKMYGTTYAGGLHDDGTIFEYNPLANGLLKLADFDLDVTGRSAQGGVVFLNNKLYGCTSQGEPFHYNGKLYEYDFATQLLTPLTDFDLDKGRNTLSRLTVVGNKLMGMTNIGGDYFFGGVVFEYNPANNEYKRTVNFNASNGRLPRNNELTKIPAPAAPGVAGSCINARDFIDISAANANEWVPYTDAQGRAVAEINANGNLLGRVEVRFFINDGALRQQNGTYYADRNITISTEHAPVTPVSIRLYLKNSEFLTLRNTPNSGVVLPADIALFRNNDFCSPAIASNSTMLPTTHTTWGVDHVYRAEVGSFSSFYFAAAAKVLPVQLLSFTGQAAGSVNNLTWKAQCTGDNQFTIERSADGNNYQPIGEVAATAADCNAPFYFTDGHPLDQNFYRLRITEDNNSIKYSNVVVISNEHKPALLVQVAPNPVVGAVAKLIITSTTKQPIQLRLTDAAGRVLHSQQVAVQAGINAVELPVARLPAGSYFLQYNGKEGKPATIQMQRR